MHRFSFLVGIMVIGIALLFGLLITQPNVSAQDSPDTFEHLLNDLWEQVLSEQTGEASSDFTFSIEYKESISGLGNSTTLGQSLNTLNINRIGENYFCLSRAFSRTVNVDCIPFDNILKISYRDEQ